jgi:putative tryptophan/tyrosine transport system substrate-binding protein
MTIDISRRNFIAALGGTAATWPLAARARQPAMPIIGYLNQRSGATALGEIAAFWQGLNEIGFWEGRNVAVEYRWAQNQNDLLPTMAADLVGRRVAVIVAGGAISALAAKAVTSTIPIIFLVGVDPVKLGLVTSLNRPASNATGVNLLGNELGSKCLEVLHKMLPKVTKIAYLWNSQNLASKQEMLDVQTAAEATGQQIQLLTATNEAEINRAFDDVGQLGAGALLVGLDPFFTGQIDRFLALAALHRIPVLYPYGEFARAGGLVSYGTSLRDAYRTVGTYTGRVLNGEKPSDLPVQQSTRVELIINLKTAKALGLTVPPSLLVLTDEVIE